ncbi:MAG: transcription termination/antitermination factor NusG [Gemmatimonadetes bacterium]|jgi:transcriptional antiterminator NusG|nr:transcription termination/antitermination protein NusG [Gemmatimonadota bacterium]MDE2700616.1 transcription termination/antitermination protein NusG [Gemmatimonadota bacterium]MDE2725874.1 transcription termination/antitermination protein NusG [Gemmatimonadota bacterium]MDE2831270.1 transcription termination/antitermination protein NusG [Gemmatimonadota bacterium]MXX12504.1 transcription termination/antitermination factor NusG [Gemmatimonadota bacterium]
MKWYVVHTYSGHENKVKSYIEAAKENIDVGDKIGRVIVPTEEVVEMKDGRKTTSLKKFLPSYLLVELDMDKESLYFVTSVPGVTSFVGPGRRPQPLREEEVNRILGQIERRPVEETSDVPYQVGDRVKVIDGPFSDFIGLVDDINPEKSKIKVMVSIFGRNTPVELDVLQVEEAVESR